MNRRQFVATAGLGTVSLLSGCTDIGNGDGEDPLDGEWVIRARVVNEDAEPREWRVESRSTDRQSVVAAWGTLPATDETELALSGRLFDEQREVFVESDGGAVSHRWQPTECRRLFAAVSIVDSNPSMETACRGEQPPRSAVSGYRTRLNGGGRNAHRPDDPI